MTYTNPATGAPILAQRIRPGIDPAGAASGRPGYGRFSVNRDPAACVFLDRDDIKGDDLCAFTNGLNVEEFDQQGTQLEFTWDISDSMTFIALGGTEEFKQSYLEDTDLSSVDDIRAYFAGENQQNSLELRLEGSTDRLANYVLGAYLAGQQYGDTNKKRCNRRECVFHTLLKP